MRHFLLWGVLALAATVYGDTLTPPVAWNFYWDGDTARELFTCLDPDNDARTDNDGYTHNAWYYKADEGLYQYLTDADRPGNDYLVSPSLALGNERMYMLRFNVNMGGRSRLKATIGTSPDATTHTILADFPDMNDSWMTPYEIPFRVENPGTYHLAIYCYNDAQGWYTNLFDFEVRLGVLLAQPAPVTALTATAAPRGALRATLSGTLPTTTLGDTPLASPLTVIIERNGTEAAQLQATPGQQLTWEDTAPAAGNNTYSVVAVTPDGHRSEPATTEVWVGQDRPAAPASLTIRTDAANLNPTLTWTPVTDGANGGYLDPDVITYTVLRSLDKNNWSTLATDLTGTTYTDTDISDPDDNQDCYYYAVQSTGGGGSGDMLISLVVAGAPYTLPLRETFPGGHFDIYPWTTDPILGSFAWENIHDDYWADMYPYDRDRGFSRFQNMWSAEADSRLKSPVIDLRGTVRPTLSLFMYRWEATSIAADNGATTLTAEIRVDDGEWTPLGDPVHAGADEAGWHELFFPLDDYRDARKVQIGLRGYTDNNWMYYYVDLIRLDERRDADMEAIYLTGPAEVAFNSDATYAFEVLNRGTATADTWSAELLIDGTVVQTLTGDPLPPSRRATLHFTLPLLAPDAARTLDISARINLAADQLPDNNLSNTLTTTVGTVWYPTAATLSATRTDTGDVTLTWEPPTLPDTPTATTDGFEDYTPFAITGIGPWTMVDGDEAGSNCWLWGVPDFENEHTNMAFQVWAPALIDGLSLDDMPELAPYEGDQCLVAWYADTAYGWDDPVNDDWLISPELTGGTPVTLMLSRTCESDATETYELMYSATDTRPASFTPLADGFAPWGWEQVSVTLPDDTRYFALHYTGSIQSGILVDNISYTHGIHALEVVGYNIFRDGVPLNDTPIAGTTWTDTDAPGHGARYDLSVVYNRGESTTLNATADTWSALDTSAHLPVHTRYYDLMGRPLAAPTPRGITIVEQHYPDGTTVTRKHIAR